MGDRCDVWIKFGGKISRQAAEALIEVLNDEYYTVFGSNPDGGEKVEMGDLDEEFSAEEVNYANIDEIDAVCREHGIHYDMQHGAGGGYSAGCIRFLNGRKEETPATNELEPLVPLKKVLEVDTLASGLGKLIDLARFMLGDFPNLEVEGTTVSEAGGST